MTTDNQASPEDMAAALKRDGYYYTSEPLQIPPQSESFDAAGSYYINPTTRTWVCEWETTTKQDDFIRKGRGVLLALAGCAVFWALVFLPIGGV